MKMLSKMAMVSAVFCASILTAQAEQVKVAIVAEPYPPFSTMDASGTWVGWEIELIDAVCGEAELDCVITPIPWDAMIPSLASKKIDVIMSSMSITEKRMETIDFSDFYYRDNGYAIIARKEAAIQPTPEGLKGKILGVQGSTNGEAYASKHFSKVVAELKLYQSLDEVTQDLAAGRIDAGLASRISLNAFLRSEQGKACCEVKGMGPSDPEFARRGVGAGLRKGDTDLKEKINAAIKHIRASGKYKEITDKYFDFDIYGD